MPLAWWCASTMHSTALSPSPLPSTSLSTLVLFVTLTSLLNTVQALCTQPLPFFFLLPYCPLALLPGPEHPPGASHAMCTALCHHPFPSPFSSLTTLLQALSLGPSLSPHPCFPSTLRLLPCIVHALYGSLCCPSPPLLGHPHKTPVVPPYPSGSATVRPPVALRGGLLGRLTAPAPAGALAVEGTSNIAGGAALGGPGSPLARVSLYPPRPRGGNIAGAYKRSKKNRKITISVYFP